MTTLNNTAAVVDALDQLASTVTTHSTQLPSHSPTRGMGTQARRHTRLRRATRRPEHHSNVHSACEGSASAWITMDHDGQLKLQRHRGCSTPLHWPALQAPAIEQQRCAPALITCCAQPWPPHMPSSAHLAAVASGPGG